MKKNIIDWQGEFEKNVNNPFNYVYHQFEKRLWHFAFRLIQHREDAEDIAADVLRKFFERQAGFDNISSISSFLYTTCRNDCFNYLKAKKIRRENLAVLAHISDAHTTIDPFSRKTETEILVLLNEHINDLPDETQKVIRESFSENNAEKVAKKLGKNAQNVRNLKNGGISKLREALRKKLLVLLLPVFNRKKNFFFALLNCCDGCSYYSALRNQDH